MKTFDLDFVVYSTGDALSIEPGEIWVSPTLTLIVPKTDLLPYIVPQNKLDEVSDIIRGNDPIREDEFTVCSYEDSLYFKHPLSSFPVKNKFGVINEEFTDIKIHIENIGVFTFLGSAENREEYVFTNEDGDIVVFSNERLNDHLSYDQISWFAPLDWDKRVNLTNTVSPPDKSF